MEVVYERDPDVGNGYVAFRGCIRDALGTTPFTGVHFEAIIRLVSKHIAPEDDALSFIRSDRPELQPFTIGSELLAVIRNKPEEAVQRMSYPEVRIVVGRPPAPLTTLRACARTLAAAFGERVLCRARDLDIECPGCGRWCPSSDSRHRCPLCGLEVAVERCDNNWVFVSVTELLASKLERFFLPREWNGFKPWVDRARLEELYKAFLLTKENFDVCDQ